MKNAVAAFVQLICEAYCRISPKSHMTHGSNFLDHIMPFWRIQSTTYLVRSIFKAVILIDGIELEFELNLTRCSHLTISRTMSKPNHLCSHSQIFMTKTQTMRNYACLVIPNWIDIFIEYVYFDFGFVVLDS